MAHSTQRIGLSKLVGICAACAVVAGIYAAPAFASEADSVQQGSEQQSVQNVTESTSALQDADQPTVTDTAVEAPSSPEQTNESANQTLDNHADTSVDIVPLTATSLDNADEASVAPTSEATTAPQEDSSDSNEAEQPAPTHEGASNQAESDAATEENLKPPEITPDLSDQETNASEPILPEEAVGPTSVLAPAATTDNKADTTSPATQTTTDSKDASTAKTNDAKDNTASEASPAPAPVLPVANGTYIIQSSLAKSFVLDVAGGPKGNKKAAANVQIYTSNKTDAQRWRVQADENGLYTIQSVVSGKYLDLCSAKAANGSNIWQYNENGTPAQKWSLVKDGSGFRIVSAVNSDYAVDVTAAKAKNSTNVQLYKINGTPA